MLGPRGVMGAPGVAAERRIGAAFLCVRRPGRIALATGCSGVDVMCRRPRAEGGRVGVIDGVVCPGVSSPGGTVY